MIPRSNRFRGRASLRFVYQNGRTVRGPLFSIKSTVNPKRRSYRASVVVSRKVSKSAVVRNRIRRRLYSALGRLDADIVEPYDIVITVFHDTAATEPAEKLSNQLKNQLKEAGILAKRVTG